MKTKKASKKTKKKTSAKKTEDIRKIASEIPEEDIINNGVWPIEPNHQIINHFEYNREGIAVVMEKCTVCQIKKAVSDLKSLKGIFGN